MSFSLSSVKNLRHVNLNLSYFGELKVDGLINWYNKLHGTTGIETFSILREVGTNSMKLMSWREAAVDEIEVFVADCSLMMRIASSINQIRWPLCPRTKDEI